MRRLSRSTPTLAWETVVTGLQHDGTPSRLHVITDATTGAELFQFEDIKTGTGNSQYNGTVTIGTTLSGSTYQLNDSTRGAAKTYNLSTHTDTLSQSVTIPSGCTGTTFTFYLHIDTAETTTSAQYDKLTVTAGSTTLATYSNLNAASGYVAKSLSLSAYAGTTVTLKFTGVEDSSLQTSFVIDDTAVTTS